MAQLINVRLSRHDGQPWGLRLQGGKDFGTPLVVQKVSDFSCFRSGLCCSYLFGICLSGVGTTDANRFIAVNMKRDSMENDLIFASR